MTDGLTATQAIDFLILVAALIFLSVMLIIAACAIILVWNTSIFEVIAYTSRAFAFYYFAQTVLAFLVVFDQPDSRRKWLLLTAFGLMSGVLGWVSLYAIPAA